MKAVQAFRSSSMAGYFGSDQKINAPNIRAWVEEFLQDDFAHEASGASQQNGFPFVEFPDVQEALVERHLIRNP